MTRLLDRFGPWALVTGASSGIGLAFAKRLAAEGFQLVLVARSRPRLESLAAELEREHGRQVRVAAVDLARDDFMSTLRSVTDDIEIGLLVNNAGTATDGEFLDGDLSAELEMLHLNSRAPMILTHAFGKPMRRRGRGGIIFVSSVLAFSGVPSWSHYAATKAHDLVFAEGLAGELHRDGVAVNVVTPGPTRTPLWRGGDSGPIPMATPGTVANAALRKLGKRTTTTVGLVNALVTLSTRLLPRRWNARIFRTVVGLMNRGPSATAHSTAKKRRVGDVVIERKNRSHAVLERQ